MNLINIYRAIFQRDNSSYIEATAMLARVRTKIILQSMYYEIIQPDEMNALKPVYLIQEREPAN